MGGKASSTLPDEERKVDEKSVAEKVSEAIASGAIDDSRVVKDDDEDKESIVEKDQIEEMETCPVDDLETGKDFVKDNEDDEDDIELQRIKDEDDEVEENHAPVPDIAEKMSDDVKDSKKELEQKNVPGNLVLEKEKISYSHVKTPDEVDDLPEHEVVVPDSHLMDEIKSEMSGDLEEKIALDENEKETDGCKKELINEKSEGSVEAVRDNEIVEVAVEQKRMQVNATTPLNENLGEDFLKQANEPEFVEDKQYLTTDKDKEIDEKHVEVETEKDVYVGEKDKIDEEINDEAKDSSTKAQEDIEDESPLIKPGLLKVIVFKGSELVNKDIIGKSDPFLKIKFRDQELKSQKVRNSLEPEWNFSANLIISSSKENSDIVIEVYDDDFGKENFIGSYTFPLNQAILDTDKEASWNNLVGCKTGKISFSTFYLPDDIQDKYDIEVNECKEKDIDESNEKVDMSKDNILHEEKSTENDIPDTDRHDSTVTPSKDKEQSSKISDNKEDKHDSVPVAELTEIRELPKEIEEKDEGKDNDVSESSSDNQSESSNSSEKGNIKESINSEEDEKEIDTEKGLIEGRDEKCSDVKDIAPDSFINDIYTTEGRQSSLEKDSEVSEDKNKDTAPDSLINDIYTSEGRQADINKELVETEQDEDILEDIESEGPIIKPGLLKVIVFKGSELVNKDMIGKSDPFLKIKFRDQELKSHKVRNSLEPEWNFSANLIISSSEENSDITIEVFDDDFGKENFIGSYTFPLKQAIKETDKEASWNNLTGCKTGKISFSTF